MGYRTKDQHFVTCDVCQRVETFVGQESVGTALDFARSNDWWYSASTDCSADAWHACPLCRHSQEFHLGLPAANTLIDGGMDPRRAWMSVNALVTAGLIVGPPDESA